MEALLKDIGFALRSLRKHPVFTLTASITLALGIGASTAIFSVLNAVLLRPLPYANSDRLVLIWIDMRARNVRDLPFSGPGYVDLQNQTTSFSDIAGLNPFRTGFAANNERPEQVSVLAVTPNLLSVLGARVAIGRAFGASDAFAPQASPGAQPPPLPSMIILTNDYWRRHFGGDANVIGKSVDFGGGPGTVVGVLPPEFEMLFPPNANIDPHPDMLVAQRVDYATAPRLNPFIRLVGRLKPGVTLAAANQDAERASADARARFTIIKTADAHYRVESMSADLVADVRPAIVALMGAVIAVLLIACANVANLLLVRAASRQRELTIRAAVGGSSRRLIAQLLAESLVLAASGAVGGLALAYTGIKVLAVVAPVNLPRIDEVRIDSHVLAFMILVTLIAAMIFGLAPALRASRPDLAAALRATGRTPSLGGGQRLRNAVVTAEVALTFVLLIGGGLMVRSFIAIVRTDPGFDPNGMLTFSVTARANTTPDQRQAFVTQLRDKLRAIPGVVAVTAASPFPLDGGIATIRWGTEEAASDPSKFQQTNVHVVLPGYFEAMRTRVIAGRTFTEEDNRPEVLGVVIDSLFAAKAFPGQSAIGRRILARARATPEPEWLNVIGVVAHERHQSLAVEGRDAMFLPDRFIAPGSVSRWGVRINCERARRCDPTTIGQSARSAVAQVDPLVPVAELRPMSALVDRATAATRFALVLIGTFAGVAAVLACVGLYGVLSTSVRQRTGEIGIRMAYGATTRSIFGLVIGGGIRLALVGLVIGLIASLGLTRGMTSMLVGVRPTDIMTYGSIVTLFLCITVLACWLPARRAASLDPASALRGD